MLLNIFVSSRKLGYAPFWNSNFYALKPVNYLRGRNYQASLCFRCIRLLDSFSVQVLDTWPFASIETRPTSIAAAGEHTPSKDEHDKQ